MLLIINAFVFLILSIFDFIHFVTPINPNFHRRQHLQIHWNSSNTLFRSPHLLIVYLGDSIDFLCPHYINQIANQSFVTIEYNTLYLVLQNDYQHCNSSGYYPLLRCNRPYNSQRLIYTLSIAKYLPYPNVPEFDDEQYYYFISTSSGQLADIDQHENGLCRKENMRLVINVHKSPRHYHHYAHRRQWPPIVAKRTNLTFVDSPRRFLLASSSSTSTTPINLTLLLIMGLLIKSKT